jgi:hypothetical protein
VGRRKPRADARQGTFDKWEYLKDLTRAPDRVHPGVQGAIGAATKILMTLLSRADADGWCFTNRKTLAHDVGVPVSTVDDHIKRLKEIGALSRRRKRLESGELKYGFQLHPVAQIRRALEQGQHRSRRGRRDTQ